MKLARMVAIRFMKFWLRDIETLIMGGSPYRYTGRSWTPIVFNFRMNKQITIAGKSNNSVFRTCHFIFTKQHFASKHVILSTQLAEYRPEERII